MRDDTVESTAPRTETTPLRRLRRFLFGGQLSKRRNNVRIFRLELESEREELDRLGGDTYWYDHALDVLGEYEDAVDQAVWISSSRVYYSVQRLAALGLIDDASPSRGTDTEDRASRLREYRHELLQTKAHAAYIDAIEKLGSWRLEMIRELLTDDGTVKSNVTATDVYAAFQALQEFSDSRDLIFAKLQRQLVYYLSIALGTMFVLLVAVLFVPGVAGPLFGTAVDVDAARFLVPVVLFGVLGASANALLSLFDQAYRGRIVESRQLYGLPLAVARAVAGGISALLLFAVLESGIFAIAFSPGVALSFAFAAGFSEELVRRAVSAVSGQVSTSDEDSRR